ncbi:MAG: hypothetical protein A2Z08_01325 [Deltaproteobacteria bacterium RBG_16_54_11]|nr:MAG: hypothetical protein A2Z08_01325 [Deltaproteobacteria bacterium RBG_16_54_11]
MSVKPARSLYTPLPLFFQSIERSMANLDCPSFQALLSVISNIIGLAAYYMASRSMRMLYLDFAC